MHEDEHRLTGWDLVASCSSLTLEPTGGQPYRADRFRILRSTVNAALPLRGVAAIPSGRNPRVIRLRRSSYSRNLRL